MGTRTDIISLDNQTSNVYRVTLSGREYTAVGVSNDHVIQNVSTPDTNYNPGAPDPVSEQSYSIIPLSASVDEGTSLSVSISTTNVFNGAVLYWTVTNGGDFVINTDQVTITNNSGQFNVTPIADLTTEGPETFYINLRTDSNSGPIVAVSNALTINDTSITPDPPIPTYAIAADEDNVDEGSALNVTVTTENVANSTTLYWDTALLGQTSSTADIVPAEGEVIINSNSGSIIVTPDADSLTEGLESFFVLLKTGSSSGPIVASTGLITINDTSTDEPTPPPGEPEPESPTPSPPPVASALVSSDGDTNQTSNNIINIFANFDTTAVTDPEREYYNLPRNELPVLNQVTASTRVVITENAPIDKLVFSTTGIDGYGYNDTTFNFDTNYFQNQIIYFTVRVKTVNNYPAKYLNNLNIGNGSTNDTITIDLKDENNNSLAASISSDFGVLSADVVGGFFKGAFQYNGSANNVKLKAKATSNNVPVFGESNTFNIVPVSGSKEFRKINENNNQKDNFISYLYQPNLRDNPRFFTDIIGQIVGDANDPSTLGVKVYEKISNFLLNSNDIEYANIDNLISNLKLIDSNVNKFSESYPASLKRIVDFFSVNRSKIIPIKNKFNQDFNSKGRSDSGLGKNLGSEIKLSDTLSGGDNFKPIVAYEKFSQRYYMLNTDPTSGFDFRYLGSNKTYQISSYNTNWGWGLVLPDGVGDFTYMLDISGNNLVLENGFRILNEDRGLDTNQISKYYTFFEYISTSNNSNIFAFYDDANINSNSDLSSLSAINNSIDEIILKDIYSGTKLI